MATRVKYDPRHLDSVIDAAKRMRSAESQFIYATAYGYTIAPFRPPYGQEYYIVTPKGEIYHSTHCPEGCKAHEWPTLSLCHCNECKFCATK